MKNFNNASYRALVTDLLGDIFYIEGRSNRGTIATIRQYSEVIVRRILDLPEGSFVTLGHGPVQDGLKQMSANNPLLLDAVEAIRKLGNDTTHTSALREFTDGDVEHAIAKLFDLYASLFIEYFNKYQFGSHLAVTASFSILPPIIRYIALTYLYENDPGNANIIDKYSLAILKAFDRQAASEWVNARKSALVRIPSVSNEFLAEMEAQLGEAFSTAYRQQAPNMYELCVTRVAEVAGMIEKNGRRYDDFESALAVYQREGKVEGNAGEIVEFNSLMEFVYLGRRPGGGNGKDGSDYIKFEHQE